MKEDIKRAIKTFLGNADAPSFIKLLDNTVNSENVAIHARGFSIPIEDAEDIEALQQLLSKLSTVGRAFPITLKDGLIIIDTIAMKVLPSASRESFFQGVHRLGIREEHVELQPIAKGSKVLDVRAGTDFLLEG